MNWIKPSHHPTGFDGAEVVFISETHLLARWNHSKCRGWQLYARSIRRVRSRPRWLKGAGVDSLEWTEQQTLHWAEQHIDDITQDFTS